MRIPNPEGRWLFEREPPRIARRDGFNCAAPQRTDPSSERAPRLVPRIKWVPLISVTDEARSLSQCCTREGSTYVVRGADKVKIGKSIKVPERIRDIQAMSPVPLTIIAVSRGLDLESKLHEVCAAARSHGEWFNLNAWEAIKSLFASSLMCASCMLDDGGYINKAAMQPARVMTRVPARLQRPRTRIVPAEGQEQLTARQTQVLEFIESIVTETRRTPTIRAIADHLGVSSSNGIKDHLDALVRKGWLRREPLEREPPAGIQVSVVA